MEHEQSSSNMVLKQLNADPTHKFIEKVKQNDPFSDTSYSKNFFKLSVNQEYDYDEKNLHLEKQSLQQNKQNNVTGYHSQVHTINSTQITEHCENDKSGFVKNKIVQQQKIRKNSRKLSTILLNKITSQQKYVKKLRQYLPANTVSLCKIMRQKSIFSLNLTLSINSQQMFRFVKSQGCMASSYEIISENKIQNKVGCLKSDLTGSIFNIYEHRPSNATKLVGTICYNDQFSFHSQPRKVQMYILRQNQILEQYQQSGGMNIDQNLKVFYEKGSQNKIMKLVNRKPVINSKNQYGLDFGTQDIMTSAKNVILEEEKTNKALLLLYKKQQKQFQLKVKQGLSVFIGYCFVLSSMVFKLACQ